MAEAAAHIEDGTRVLATTASGDKVPMVATGQPRLGQSRPRFMVVPVCTVDDYERGDHDRALSWPLEDVELADAPQDGHT